MATNSLWAAKYGYQVGGSKAFAWFWIRDEYTPNEPGWATRFPTADDARLAAQEAVSAAVAIQPHLMFRTQVVRVATDRLLTPIN